MEKMKYLARTAVYWPGIDADISDLCQRCTPCAEHRNLPNKAPVHPWIPAELPWSRIHVDHAINFMGSNWFVIVDAYSKYPCVYATSSTSTKSTTDLLDDACAHFGYPHTIVSDNATTFTSEEFKSWCAERGITHLSGAPYHPQTNGAAERLVQTFKQALRKSKGPVRAALSLFLMQYRRTPLPSGSSPSELLIGRQIRAKIDTIRPLPPTIPTITERDTPPQRQYQTGSAVYALYCGPRRSEDPRWVAAVVIIRLGTRTVSVRVHPRGPVWKRHIDQLRPRYGASEDSETEMSEETSTDSQTAPSATAPSATPPSATTPTQSGVGSTPIYTRDNPRRSKRSLLCD